MGSLHPILRLYVLRSIFVVHDLKTLRIDPVAAGIDVVVSGQARVREADHAGSRQGL
jgi:hypothetical protein